MPIQGFIRFRKHQIGKETTFSSNTPATIRLPYRGPIVVEPNRTTPDVDTGSLDPVLAAFLGPQDVTGTWEGKAAFDYLPITYALGIMGGVSPTGAVAKTWTFQAASLTADPFDTATDEWADDVSSDSIVAAGGVVDSWGLTAPDSLEALDITHDLFYAKATFGAGMTAGLEVDTTPQWVYGAHTVIYMDSNPLAIGITPLANNMVHGWSFTVNNNLDRKRYANGSNTGFQLAGYGRGPREIEFVVRLAKTTETIAEAQTLDDSPVPTRYFDIKTTSTEMTTGSTPYSNSIRFPAELIGRSDTEIDNNSVIELTYRGKYDSTLAYALRAVVVCTLSSF